MLSPLICFHSESSFARGRLLVSGTSGPIRISFCCLLQCVACMCARDAVPDMSHHLSSAVYPMQTSLACFGPLTFVCNVMHRISVSWGCKHTTHLPRTTAKYPNTLRHSVTHYMHMELYGHDTHIPSLVSTHVIADTVFTFSAHMLPLHN